MRYLITGGAGFIGSHLAETLVAAGNDVLVLDNLSTGNRGNLCEIEHRIGFVNGSVLDPLLVDELVAEVDVIVHLAAAVGVKLIVERPLRSLLTNIRGSETVLEAAHRYRRKVMLASTSEIYGKSSTGRPFQEDDDRVLGSPKVSRWAYSTSKSVDEILAYAYYREKGLPTVVVRLFNTVGPRQSSAYGMVIPRLVEQALRHEPLTIYGDGLQTRCFCHVHDVVNALVVLADEVKAVGDVFNIGSTEEISIRDLAQRIIAATGSRSELKFVPYEQAYESGFEDMRRRIPDITKIESLTGWRPRKNLDAILHEVIHERLRQLPISAELHIDPVEIEG